VGEVGGCEAGLEGGWWLGLALGHVGAVYPPLGPGGAERGVLGGWV